MKKIIFLFLFVNSLSHTAFSQCGTTVIPSVTIASTANTICAGTSVTFTAKPVNGGITAYQWWMNGANIPSATNSTYTTSAAQNGNHYRVDITSTEPCAVVPHATSNVIVMTVTSPVVAGTISTDQTICTGATPTTLTGTASTGGASVKYYKWQSSSMITGAWTQVAPYSTTGTDFAPGSLSATTYYRRIDSSGVCEGVPTNAVIIIVKNTIPSVSIASNHTTICEGNPVIFTATPIEGGTLPLYQWYIGTTQQGQATTNSTFTTSDLKAVPGNTVKAELVSDADCASTYPVASNIIVVNVNPGIKPGALSSDQVICYGTAAAKIIEVAASDAVTATYIWEQAIDLSTSNWAVINGTPSNGGKDLTPSDILISDMFYRRKVEDAAAPAPCAVSYTNPVKIIVKPDVTAGVINGNATSCEGSPTTSITSTSLPTGGSTFPYQSFTYVWESSVSSFGPYFLAPSTNTGTSYSPGVLNSTTYYRRKEVNSCKTVYSNVITKTITPNTVVGVSISDPVQTCAGTPITITATPTGGGTAPLYRWSKNANVVAVGANATYTFTPVIGDDNGGIVVRLTSSEACNTGDAISSPITLHIDPCGAFSSSISGPNSITPGQQGAVYRVYNQSSFSYDWSVTGGTIVSGQHTNSVTVDWDASVTSNFARTTAAAYSISVTETNPSNQKNTTTVDLSPVITSVSKSLQQAGISLFPNPATESFNIEMSEMGIAVSYEILDLTGTFVATGNFISSSNAEKITANFGAGMYQVVLRYNNVVTTGRLSKVQ